MLRIWLSGKVSQSGIHYGPFWYDRGSGLLSKLSVICSPIEIREAQVAGDNEVLVAQDIYDTLRLTMQNDGYVGGEAPYPLYNAGNLVKLGSLVLEFIL